MSELISLVVQQRPSVVCIGALPSGGAAAHTRHLCKRLRLTLPDLKIVVGRWGSKESKDHALLHAAGADHVGTTLVETRDQIQQVSQLEPDSLSGSLSREIPSVSPPRDRLA